MFKVILLLVLFDPDSGELKGVVSPIPAFENVAQCEAAKKQFLAENPAPPGLSGRGYCIDPRAVSI